MKRSGRALLAACLATSCQAEPERVPDREAERAAQPEGPAQPRSPDVLYVPTPEAVVDRMLELARVGPNDVVYDLGCGDGRIVAAAAARHGARAVGYDIDPVRVAEARHTIARYGVERLVQIEQRDIFTLDLSAASVVALYLLPELNVRLLPQLERLKPGARIVSHDFDMDDWKEAKKEEVTADRTHTIYLWTIKKKK
jgi:SAM-dependent methyltransferase